MMKKSLFFFKREGENGTVFDPVKPCISSRKEKQTSCALGPTLRIANFEIHKLVCNG